MYYDYPARVNEAWILVPMIIFLTLLWLFKTNNHSAAFGISFFLVTIGMVLQLIPIGGAILAERYTYLSYFGLFFAASTEIKKRWVSFLHNLRFMIISGTMIWISWLALITLERLSAWKNTEALFGQEIRLHPGYYKTYWRLARVEMEFGGDFGTARAHDHLLQCLSLAPDSLVKNILGDIGNNYVAQKKYDSAILFYEKILSQDSADPIARYNLKLTLRERENSTR